MKDKVEFFAYLTETLTSPYTGKPILPKVARDTMSRCRRVERALAIDLKTAVASERKYQALIEKIKENRGKLGATPANPYGHLSVVRAVLLYKTFTESTRNPR